MSSRLPLSTRHSTLDTPPSSLDHFIRPRQHVARNRHAHLFGRFQVGQQLKLRPLLELRTFGIFK
jgi:hypothetical protein